MFVFQRLWDKENTERTAEQVTILNRVVMEPRGERQLCGEASCTNPNTNASFLLGEDCTVRIASVQNSSQNTKQILPLQID